jgi:uncharacterized protein (DUF2147 family)
MRMAIPGIPAFTLVSLFWVAASLASAPAAAPMGHWLTQPKDGIIEITQTGDGTLQGQIVGGAYPGKKDANNPDPALRDRPLRGQIILQGLKADGPGRWSGGTIYDPDSGRTYKCYIVLQPDGSLKVRGFIGFSLLGKSQTWTRYTGTSMDLPPPK